MRFRSQAERKLTKHKIKTNTVYAANANHWPENRLSKPVPGWKMTGEYHDIKQTAEETSKHFIGNESMSSCCLAQVRYYQYSNACKLRALTLGGEWWKCAAPVSG